MQNLGERCTHSLVTLATMALDLHQALDVHGRLSPQVSLNGVVVHLRSGLMISPSLACLPTNHDEIPVIAATYLQQGPPHIK